MISVAGFSWCDTLQRYFLGSDCISGLDCYLFKDPSHLWADFPNECDLLLKECHRVQNAVWTPKYSTFHNTFEQKYLLVLAVGDKVAGFMSSSPFRAGDSTFGLYYSDAMLLPEFQKRGLSYLSYALLHQAMRSRFPITSSRTLNIVISGNIALFRFFLNEEIFRQDEEFNFETLDGQQVLSYVRKDFPTQEIDKKGIIRRAWLEQLPPSAPRWPANEARRLKFPEDVNFENGDALFRVFELRIGAETKIDNFICSRLLERSQSWQRA